MLMSIDDDDFATIIAGGQVRGRAIAPGGLENTGIMAMLRAVARDLGGSFTPNAWVMIEAGEVVGLCSVTAVDLPGVLTIGYGVAATRRRRGFATRAVGDLLAWAQTDARVAAITAATVPANPASQRALAANGFVVTGKRVDPEDGELIEWRRDISRLAAPGTTV